MQYPHYLYRLEHAEATRNVNGNWQTPNSTWVYVCKCREETNGAGQKVILSDGKDYLFNSLIQIPVNNVKIHEGTRVIISNSPVSESDLLDKAKVTGYKLDGTIRIEGECKKYDVNTYHNRMWM